VGVLPVSTITKGFNIMQNAIRATFIFLLLGLQAQFSWADDYSDAINSFKSAGESGNYFSNSYGYAVFPTIGKAGLGIGGSHGTGKVYQQGQVIGESKMTQLSVGLQAGGQVYSQIIFFEDEGALKAFTSGNFEFSAQATAVAITAGVSAEANTGGGTAAGASGGKNDASTTSRGYRKGMAIFTVAKGGLMYEAALGGQKYSYKPL
jgi:lipid-binding SYLF domain-containing protein